MHKQIFTALFACSCLALFGQQYSISLGAFTGMTIPYTWDTGIAKDPRYENKYNVRMAPIGLTYGMDFQRIGFMVNPHMTIIGQDFYMLNSVGGQYGERKINLQYINVPVSFKLSIIKLSFFRLNAVVSAGPAFLLNAEETISHQESKMTFPEEVYPILPPDYIIEFDGVIVPPVDDLVLRSKSDFNPVQFFGGAGFRTDWDINNDWRISLDFMAYMTLKDPRTEAYINEVNNYESIYDLPGERRDIYGMIGFGIARYIDLDRDDQKRKRKLKGTGRLYTPKKSDRSKSSKPKQ